MNPLFGRKPLCLRGQTEISPREIKRNSGLNAYYRYFVHTATLVFYRRSPADAPKAPAGEAAE
jgi:hypothetical protein